MSTPLRWIISVLLIALISTIGLDYARAQEASTPEDELIPFTEGSVTLVVLPDTEGYTSRRPHIFNAMMQWIADNKDTRNIACVLHVGDITNNNTDREWQNARRAFDFIEGKIPYILAAGNHDYDHTPGRLTYMNKYFHVADMRKWPAFGDAYEKGKLENHYQFVKIHGCKWIVLSLEMGPRKGVIEWANKILEQHREHPAIILTHAYLYYGSARYDHRKGGQRATPYNFYGDGMDGEMMWNQLVRIHPNIHIVICGHLSSQYVAYRKDEADYGNIVHQMLVDYEKMKGGYGFLRLLEFLPDRKTVQVWTYSPYTKKTNPRNQKLEEFRFVLQGPTRREPCRVLSEEEKEAIRTEPLARAPIHRYSFNKVGERNVVADSVGGAHGILQVEDSGSRIDEGRLVLTGNGYVALPPEMLRRNDATVEVWFAPAGDAYNWNHAVYFGDGGGNSFYYCFRTKTVHRAEIINNGHNEDIQVKGVPVEKGKMMHVVMTFKQAEGEGRSRLCYYRNGERRGSMAVGVKIAGINDNKNRIGPFEGIFDELRVYDYALSKYEVRGNFKAGADEVKVAD